MDARYMGAHMKNGEGQQLDGPCMTTRLFNSTYQTEGYPGLNQKCLKRNYDEMATPYGGPGQIMLNDGCFPKPVPHQQTMLYRQPYSIPMGSSLNNEMQHLVQEPKFPPQTFEIPDIQDSNSVFSDGTFDATFSNYSTAPLPEGQAYFYGSPAPDHSQCRTLVPPPFPAAWQPGVLSSTGSTNSSPVSQAEDSTSSAAEVATLQTHQAKINGFTSHSTVSRIPNKKARSPKRRKRKDPNEPQKPVSAYSLFFRNAQAAIKSQNPSATFGDVSKIVASMWDGLDDEVKNFYKRQMEVAKKEYLKQLAIYRATLVSKDVPGKTGSEAEPGLGIQLPLPAPSAPPPAPKVEEGPGLGLSPVATSMCMSSSGYPAQISLSPAQETLSHIMSPPINHHQTSPLYYSDGPPRMSGNYSTTSDVSSVRNSFLSYGQKLDHESLMSGMPEHSGYFLGSVSDSVYKGREYLSMEKNFVNDPGRDIAGRQFADPEDGPKLT